MRQDTSSAQGLNKLTLGSVMERCCQQGVLEVFGLATTTLCGGVGLDWFSPAAEWPGEASALKLPFAEHVGEVAEGGLAAHQLNHRLKSD